MIFNIVVYAGVREVLDVVCRPQESQHILGWADGERNLVLHANDVRIAGQDHDWVKDVLTVTVSMFRRMRLKTNLEKNKYMVCTPGFILWTWVKQAYKRRVTGEGETFRERNRMRVSCTKCGVTLEDSYLK